VATATFREFDGSLFWFDVAATDSGGRVRSGSHARAIVNRSAIEARAEKRLKA
jgi:predicted thioesterase